MPSEAESTLTLKVFGVEYKLNLLRDDDYSFTGREWGTIKRISGVLKGTLHEALRGFDEELMIALAVVAMQRAGQQVIDEDKLLDTYGAVEVTPPKADESSPPVEAADAAEATRPSASPMTPQLIGRQSSQGNTASRQTA